MVLDDKGFLWIGTDNGVARFDGKYFRIFSTDDGLPDNEILEVRKENDGTIWVNTFKQGPFYFDEKTNHFIDPLKGVNINKDFVKTVLYVRTLEEGGIVFYSDNTELVFKNRKYVQLPYKAAFSYPDGKHRAYLHTGVKQTGNKNYNYIYYRNGNQSDSLPLYSFQKNDSRHIEFLKDNKLYFLSSSGKFFVVEYDKAASKFNINTITIHEELLWFRLTDKRINITSASGKIYVYDRKSLSEHYVIDEKDYSNSILEDGEKNIWVGTLNKGLKLFKVNHIELLETSTGIDDYYLSIMASENGRIYAGNYFGEILETNNNGTGRLIKPYGQSKQIWVRTIISPNGKKIFAVTEQSVLVDFKRKVMIGEELLLRMKDATSFNDSIIIAGGVNPVGGLFKINIHTEKATPLNSGLMRISKVESLNSRYVYCATNDGLFKYDYVTDRIINDFANTPLARERILEVQSTQEKLIVVATATKGIYILKDDKIISRLDNELLINNTVTDIVSTHHQSIWVGTRNGLSRVRYKLSGNKFTYEANNFSMTEGLPANVISDISYRNDTIFLATEKGVAFLPENIGAHDNIIKTFLTDIKVNRESMPLKQDNNYILNYNQRSILLEFSGIDLGGHLKRLQYSFDNKKNWINLDSDDLSIELGAGKHTLYVRAVDINGGGNHPETVIHFDVIAPFYVQPWFIVLGAALVAGLIGFAVFRIRSARQKRELQEKFKIEQERERITTDLHDDIGSTLSSLQIYSDIAYNIIDKDKEKARALLQQISSGTSKISENIGDIIWSMKANQSYALSLESRIKNIVSEAFGPTDIRYEINIDETADKNITCITCRKNIILILKEAINNISKYSQATMVDVSLQLDVKYYILQIMDNGKGFNIEEKMHAGNGLSNMKKRMQEIGGTCNLISSPGNGTKIICSFPVTKNKVTGSFT